jgi:hypothetical protein
METGGNILIFFHAVFLVCAFFWWEYAGFGRTMSA